MTDGCGNRQKGALELVSSVRAPPAVVAPSPAPPVPPVPFARDDVVRVQEASGVSFAKVIRASVEGVLLMALLPVANGARLYRVDTSRVWLHQRRVGVTFCDAVWLREQQCYEIRPQ